MDNNKSVTAYFSCGTDTTPPTIPTVTDDGDYTTDNTQLHAAWTSSSDNESGIADYLYAIGTSSGGTDVVGWTSADNATEVTHTGLNLTPGTTYYFAVRARNGACLLSGVGASDGIIVYPAKADFSANKTQVLTSQPVQFTDKSTGDITSWQWDFGDGTPSITWDNTTRPAYGKMAHSYTAKGTYTVSLTVSNPAGSNNETKTSYITVYARPEADFWADAVEVLAGQTVTFTNNSSGGIPSVNYEWDFDKDGTIDSTEQNPVYAYAVPGIYTVSLKITDGSGISGIMTRTDYITAIKATTQLEIPPEGKTVQTEDGQISAGFPSGAVTGPTTVTIKQIPPSSAVQGPRGYVAGLSYFTNQGIRVGSTCFSIEARDADGNAIVTLAEPVTITVKYTDEDLAAAGGHPNDLVLAYYDEAAREWKIIETTANAGDTTLSTVTTHLSIWAVLAKSPSASQGLALWVWTVIGIAAALGLGILAYFVVARVRARQAK